MKNSKKYWELVKLFEEFSNSEQIEFINNMIDSKTKRLDAIRSNGFLEEIKNEQVQGD